MPVGEGQREQGLYPGRDHRTGLLQTAAEGAVGEAEVLEGLRCELGHCDPPAGVAGAAGAAPFLSGAPAECKCAEIGRKGVLGAKPRNHIRPELRAGRQATGTVPEGPAAPAARHCSPSSSALLRDSGRTLAPPGRAAAGTPRRGCKGHLQLPA